MNSKEEFYTAPWLQKTHRYFGKPRIVFWSFHPCTQDDALSATNIAPENSAFQKESSFPTHPFQGRAVSFRQSKRFWVVVKMSLNHADEKKSPKIQDRPSDWNICIYMSTRPAQNQKSDNLSVWARLRQFFISKVKIKRSQQNCPKIRNPKII